MKKLVVVLCEAYQIGVVFTAHVAVKGNELFAAVLQNVPPPEMFVGVAGIELTVTIYATDGRQFGLLASGVGFKIAYT